MKQKYEGSCHCGKVRFEVDLDPADALVCDCSICAKKGVIIGRVDEEDLQLLTPLEDLTLYQFNTRTAKHYFCSNCGIYTHHQSRLDPEKFDFNIGCLEGVNPLDIENVQVFDGASHPCDSKY